MSEYYTSEYYTQTHTITGDGIDYREFGIGDTCVQDTRIYVSAPGELSTSGGDSIYGTVHIYDLNESTNQWTETAVLSTNSGVKVFGWKIDAHDSQLVIGSYIQQKKLVQIYEQQTSNTWSLTQTISSTDTNSTSGSDVSIYDDTLIVGDGGFNSARGRALVYTKSGSTWSLSTTLSGSDSATNDRFGRSVSLDQNTLAVGAPYDDDNNLVGSGSVYIFTRSGGNWTQTTKIHADDAAAYDYFGSSVGLSGTRLVVGAPHDSGESSYEGSIYIFDKQSNGDWTQTTKISGSEISGSGEQLGASVDIDGERMVASRYLNDPYMSGEVYVFALSGETTVSTAQVIGDPHMVTFDGTRYTL